MPCRGLMFSSAIPRVDGSPKLPLGIPNKLFQSLNRVLLLVRTFVRLYASRSSFILLGLNVKKSDNCMFWFNVLESVFASWKNRFTSVELSLTASRIEYR